MRLHKNKVVKISHLAPITSVRSTNSMFSAAAVPSMNRLLTSNKLQLVEESAYRWIEVIIMLSVKVRSDAIALSNLCCTLKLSVYLEAL